MQSLELEKAAQAFAEEVEAELASPIETEVPDPYVNQKTLILGEEIPDDLEPDPKLAPKESHQCQGQDSVVEKECHSMVAIAAEAGHGGDPEPANPNKDSPAVISYVPIPIHGHD